MGKKTRKAQRSHNGKRVVTPSPKVAVGDKGSVEKGTTSCRHLDETIDVGQASAKLEPSQPVRCEDCREGSIVDRATKRKGNNQVKAIWVCVECGHFSCGGVGFPTTPKSHAVQHVRSTHHRLAIQFENPNLCWCFPCSTLIQVEKSEDNDGQKNALSEIMKMIKRRSTIGSAVDVDNAWFGTGSVASEIKSENIASSVIDGRGGYVVRGLVNLGNTCFFNSIMQNLLSLDKLRDYFLTLDGTIGPLTVALKKLFVETKPEAGSRNAINPKSFFGSLCAKAPQFRGFQQQDSHELLCFLLGGLSAEELSMKRHIRTLTAGCTENETTFVDDLFGGQTSSTVCCLECGHSSTVCEPFLDLSLPVLSKRPTSKKIEPIPQDKKFKLPPKRGGRARARFNKSTDTSPSQTALKPSNSCDSFCQVQSCASVTEKTVDHSNDFTSFHTVGPDNVDYNKRPVPNNTLSANGFEANQIAENTAHKTAASSDNWTTLDCHEPETKSDNHDMTSFDCLAWLDYLEPQAISDNQDLASQGSNVKVIHDGEEKDIVINNILLEDKLDSTSQVYVQQNQKSESSTMNSCKSVYPEQVKDSEVLLLPYKDVIPTAVDIMSRGGEASSSAVNGEHDSVDFDGLGGLFDESETAQDPPSNPISLVSNIQANGVEITGFISVNGSESEPDEVDNTSSTVSVEGCLAYFTKPELLSNEHAWHCENCTKTLKEQRLNMKSRDHVNGGKYGLHNDSLSFNTADSYPIEVKSPVNGSNHSNTVSDSLGGSLVSQNQNINDSVQEFEGIGASQAAGLNARILVASPLYGGNGKDEQSEPSHSSACYRTCSQASCNEKSNEACTTNGPGRSAECNSGKANPRDSQMSVGLGESRENENGELDSGSVKVKRDATKRILINKAPPILTIHLKRFSQDTRGRLSKLKGHVHFRDTIDIRPYIDPRCMERGEYTYRLVGVVEHSGSMRGGHYVAYVKGCKKTEAGKENGYPVWYHTSDVYVREVSLEEVLHCEAYILFYEKI